MHPRHVVVGIPTYRRPELLARLLASLAREVPPDVLVVVADNDAGEEAPEVVRASGLTATCVPVARPGISEVRNALVREATARRPTWQWLVMLDDDGYVTDGWFDALMRAAGRGDAEVIGGPVVGDLPPGVSLLARNSVYAGRARHASGPVGMLNGAQNILISRLIVEVVGDPWFPPHLGVAGGEDHHFFRTVLDRGGTLAWCDEAVVHEPTPPERLTTGALLRRAYRSNLVTAQTDRAIRGRTVVARSVTVGLGWLMRNTATAAVRRSPDRLAACAIDAVSLGGRTVGLLSSRTPTGGHAGTPAASAPTGPASLSRRTSTSSISSTDDDPGH
ncbi:glycosyltransferase [Mobilicoccus sp.]|uniref:glycosyltransferase family 2 protein n=1 Tax=Mobilicoccus sp. TaxID=2034349 RepID=UPI0028A118CA|nr:glycosyltransferase [Mobilicoccus sp.]